MIIIQYMPGNGWYWRSRNADGFLEDSAGWGYLERIQRAGVGGRPSYPVDARDALREELLALELDLSLVVLRTPFRGDIPLDLGQTGD